MARLKTQALRRPTVVIGAGIVGASTACALASRGSQVLLLEQFQIGHDRGSSHGESRIIRYSYSDIFYAELMADAFSAWSKLEAETGTQLYIRTGGLSFGPADSDYVSQIASNLKELSVPCRTLTPAEVRRNYPALQLPAGFKTIYEPSAGVLMADRVPGLLVKLASKLAGGLFELREQYEVQSVEMDGEFPVVIGPSGERIEAQRVVVAAGGWVKKLLPKEAKSLEVTRQSVFHLKPEGLDDFRPGRWPVLIYKGDDEEMDLFYSLPAMSDLGVKVARHGGPKCDPDRVSRDVSAADFEPVTSFLQRFIPRWAEADPIGKMSCLYTMTPDEDFRVGPLARHPRVILASPCSGHGFKFGPLVGRIVADLCETGVCDYDISRWDPNRKPQSRKASL
jgi:sarcosine oxidase